MRLIDIEPYQKDGWILQKTEGGHDCTVIKRTPLHAIPTVDAVPVVRCKDCVYFEPENAEEGDSYGRCRNNYAPCQNQQVEMMWFCADGERQEGR